MADKNVKVLVTGATGFIGSHLLPKIIDRFDVYSFERYVTGRYVLGDKKKVKTVYGDLKEYFEVRKAIHEIQPSVVVHLAALSPVAYSYNHPHEVIETNFLGTVNLAEACLREVPHFEHFLFASTSETYGNVPVPIKEDSVQNPNSPYSVSKVSCEKYLLYMRDAYDFPVTILRPFNTYGRKDNTHFIVERTITQMLQNETTRLGDPRPVRDFLYVDDHVNAYLTCLRNEEAIGEIFNFCTGRGVSIKQLVELIAELTGFKGEIEWNTIPARPLDIMKLIGDYSKAKNMLGWKPEYTLEEGLEKTIAYWKQKLS
ncbi:MAG: NAD-dependent epimerase/dehydratase family protein [Candidatus Freyarchaeota archaeon]